MGAVCDCRNGKAKNDSVNPPKGKQKTMNKNARRDVSKKKGTRAANQCPNAETVAAMLEARRGGLTSFKSVKALMADLRNGEKHKS
jgi:hypothetical protein